MFDILTDYFSEQIERTLETFTTDAYLDKIVLTTICIFLAFGLYILCKFLLKKNIKNVKTQYFWRTVSKRVISTCLWIVVFFIWVRSINEFVIILLIVALFIVFIVKGLTSNIIGYVIIKYGKYFKEGHRIQVNDVIGDVIAVKFTHFEVLEARKWLSSDSHTGRIIKFPNSTIFEETMEVVGRKYKYIWQEIQFHLTFESDWQEAERILSEVAYTYYEDFMQHAIEEKDDIVLGSEDPYKPVFALNTNEAGIVVTLRYPVDYRQGTATKTRLHREILPQFHDHPHIHYAVQDVRILEIPAMKNSDT